MANTSNCVIPLAWRDGSRTHSIMKNDSGSNLWYCAAGLHTDLHKKKGLSYLGSAEAGV